MGETGGTQEYERWVERDVSWGDGLRKMISGGGGRRSWEKRMIGWLRERRSARVGLREMISGWGLVEGEEKYNSWVEGDVKWEGVD